MRVAFVLSLFLVHSAHAGIKACEVPTSCKAQCVFIKSEKINGVVQNSDQNVAVSGEGASPLKAYNAMLKSCHKAGGKTAELKTSVDGVLFNFSIGSACKLTSGELPVPTQACAIPTTCEATCNFKKKVRVDGKAQMVDAERFSASEHLSPIKAEAQIKKSCRGGTLSGATIASGGGICQLADEKLQNAFSIGGNPFSDPF